MADPRDHAPNVTARRTLMGAIARRIEQERWTAANAANVLHLTGPRVTELINGDIDRFTVDELVDLLPSVGLRIQVVPDPPAAT